MPIITKTVKGETADLGALRATALNMVKSLAEAVGTTHAQLTVSTEGRTNEVLYYVPMKSIGYDGWCVTVYVYSIGATNVIEGGIFRTTDNGESPDLNDKNSIGFYINSVSAISNNMPEKPETCVMICDKSKDTVLFDIHHGTTTHGEDIVSYEDRPFSIKFTLFFAKDKNENVLCGIGNAYIHMIRTSDKKMSNSFESTNVYRKPQKHKDLSGILHLTKMVNFLDPKYTEMKSAYVSIIRPVDDITKTKRVSLYDANGVRFGLVGNTDWTLQKTQSKWGTFYPPINPFVKY